MQTTTRNTGKTKRASDYAEGRERAARFMLRTIHGNGVSVAHVSEQGAFDIWHVRGQCRDSVLVLTHAMGYGGFEVYTQASRNNSIEATKDAVLRNLCAERRGENR